MPKCVTIEATHSSLGMIGMNSRSDVFSLPRPDEASSTFRWLIRSRRIILALAAIWVINVFDLGFTLHESQRYHFVELNPVAASMLRDAPHLLVAYKISLVTIASAILIALRRERVCELGCWLILAVYGCVGVRWMFYYEELLATIPDPAINVCPLTGIIAP